MVCRACGLGCSAWRSTQNACKLNQVLQARLDSCIPMHVNGNESLSLLWGCELSMHMERRSGLLHSGSSGGFLCNSGGLKARSYLSKIWAFFLPAYLGLCNLQLPEQMNTFVLVMLGGPLWSPCSPEGLD